MTSMGFIGSSRMQLKDPHSAKEGFIYSRASTTGGHKDADTPRPSLKGGTKIKLYNKLSGLLSKTDYFSALRHRADMS